MSALSPRAPSETLSLYTDCNDPFTNSQSDLENRSNSRSCARDTFLTCRGSMGNGKGKDPVESPTQSIAEKQYKSPIVHQGSEMVRFVMELITLFESLKSIGYFTKTHPDETVDQNELRLVYLLEIFHTILIFRQFFTQIAQDEDWSRTCCAMLVYHSSVQTTDLYQDVGLAMFLADYAGFDTAAQFQFAYLEIGTFPRAPEFDHPIFAFRNGPPPIIRKENYPKGPFIRKRACEFMDELLVAIPFDSRLLIELQRTNPTAYLAYQYERFEKRTLVNQHWHGTAITYHRPFLDEYLKECEIEAPYLIRRYAHGIQLFQVIGNVLINHLVVTSSTKRVKTASPTKSETDIVDELTRYFVDKELWNETLLQTLLDITSFHPKTKKITIYNHRLDGLFREMMADAMVLEYDHTNLESFFPAFGEVCDMYTI